MSLKFAVLVDAYAFIAKQFPDPFGKIFVYLFGKFAAAP
jgi:hypothetical protein